MFDVPVGRGVCVFLATATYPVFFSRVSACTLGFFFEDVVPR